MNTNTNSVGVMMMFSQRTFIVSSMLSLALLFQTGCSKPKIPTGEVTGKITVNGKPVPGIFVTFVPQERVRPAVGKTDAEGNYRAQLLAKQTGVPLGPCVAQFSLYHGEGTRNFLPPKYNEEAAKIPELNLNITEDGLVFDYDIKHDGELPPGS